MFHFHVAHPFSLAVRRNTGIITIPSNGNKSRRMIIGESSGLLLPRRQRTSDDARVPRSSDIGAIGFAGFFAIPKSTDISSIAIVDL